MTGAQVRPIARAGAVLAVLQFAFALTWIVYAALLPTLAAQVGIAKSVVPWILLVDQAICCRCSGTAARSRRCRPRRWSAGPAASP